MGKRGSSKQDGRKQDRLPNQLPDDMYDDVDKFHKENDLRFETEMDEDEDLDGEEEEGVMDLDDSDEADSDDDLEAGGQLAKIIAAERAVKQKLALQQAGANDSEAESESEDEDETWGGKKKTYYGDEEVDVDFESDDEAAKEEEEEALRLQKAQASKLSRAQFGLPEDLSEEEADEQGNEAIAAKAKTLGATAEAINHVHSETLTQALSAPARAQMRAAVLEDAPELLSLLPDLASSLGEVRHRTAPLLAELRHSPDLTTTEGLSYLDAKHMLLLMYCMHILFYILLKLEGQPVKSHPVMQRLVAAKTYLEKLKGIDKRVKHQVDKLLAAAKAAHSSRGEAGDDGELMHRANPSALVSKLDEDMGRGSGAYRPPKLASVSMHAPSGGGGRMHADSDDDLLAQAAGTATTDNVELSGKKRSREERSAQRMQRAALQKAQHSQFVKDLQAEVMDGPQEDAAVGAAAARGTDTLALLKQQQRLEARAAIEEDMMIRVALPKEEKKRLRAARRAAQAAGAAVEGFADDVEGVIAQEENAGVRQYTDKLRLGQKFGGALGNDAHTQPGGDAELPAKAALPERRARYDAVKARQAAQAAQAEAEVDAARPPRIEDEFYTETKKRHVEKKKAKEEVRRGPAPHPPLPDASNPSAARGVTREIQKNRGLTPHRKKELRNPRKANRIKFASAEKRRKGAVVAVRKPDGPYGGEATGIKSKIVKSVRLG